MENSILSSNLNKNTLPSPPPPSPAKKRRDTAGQENRSETEKNCQLAFQKALCDSYYELGEENYYNKEYNKAVACFAKYILNARESGIKLPMSKIYDAMKMTNESYCQITQKPNKTFLSFAFQKKKFYEAIKYVRDHREENNLEDVQIKLSASPIELSKGSKRPLKFSLESYKQIPLYSSRKKNLNNGKYQYSVANSAGLRTIMEDRFLVDKLDIKLKDLPSIQIELFAIFDGHGGSDCADFVKANLSAFIKRELEKKSSLTDLNIWNALKLSFVGLNDYWVSEYPFNHSGTTACLAIFLERNLWIANTGDSRAVLDREGEAIQCSKDAKTRDKKFLRGIYKRGGYITKNGRLGGILDMARAFGNNEIAGITARPKIRKIKLSSKDKTLLLGSDGIWGVLGSQEAVDISHSLTVNDIPAYLLYQAIKDGSTDNLTVLAIQLDK